MIIGKIKEPDISRLHEQTRLAMADLEDIMYSAMCRAISDCFKSE